MSDDRARVRVPQGDPTLSEHAAPGGSAWLDATVAVDADHLVLDAGAQRWTIELAGVERVDELAPFDGPLRRVEVVGTQGTQLLELPSAVVGQLCAALAATVESGAAAPQTEDGTPPRPSLGVARLQWWAVGAAALVFAVSLAVAVLGTSSSTRVHRPAVAAGPTAATRASDVTSPITATTSTTTIATTAPSTTTTTTTAARAPSSTTTTVAPAPPAPEPTVLAPLTGLPVPASAVARNAIVSKIDATAPAMPQVGLDQADMVVEVKIEWGLSRYLAVFHSRQPAVIGPHRSARTTDPDLLAMFGHPLFAFSGANPGVVDRLALTTWKTGVGPGEVGQAWFRDESRPFPHNLFAVSEVLRSRPAPPLFPVPRFFYRSPGTSGGGVPVDGLAVSVGATPLFRWDPALGGWRRWIHDREHVVVGGAPVAPTNVVVVETFYGISAADANSPEAVSLGWGRAWVFTDGHMVPGSWTRLDRNAPYDLRDAAGAPITLLPGQTWLVLADREPFIDPKG